MLLKVSPVRFTFLDFVAGAGRLVERRFGQCARSAEDLADRAEEAVVLARSAVADADVTGVAQGAAGADGDLALGEGGDDLLLLGVAEVDPGEVGLGLGGGEAELVQARLDPDALAVSAIAYEPIWAIGTGRTALPEDAGTMASIIRETVSDKVSSDAAEGLRILYGGSVNAANIKDFMAKSDVDGALVGGASLDPDSFAAIVRFWV